MLQAILSKLEASLGYMKLSIDTHTHTFKNENYGLERWAQLLIALAALEDDLGSIPCTYMTAYNYLLSLVPQIGCSLLT